MQSLQFYGAYILRKHSYEQGRAKVIIKKRDNRCMVEMQFGINMPCVFSRKTAIISDVSKMMASSFQTLGTAAEKASLPKLSFFRHNKLL